MLIPNKRLSFELNLTIEAKIIKPIVESSANKFANACFCKDWRITIIFFRQNSRHMETETIKIEILRTFVETIGNRNFFFWDDFVVVVVVVVV